jgi:hypothetical protein
MRAKLQLANIETHEACQRLYFNAVAASSYPEDGSDENNTFAKFTPSATIDMLVQNPELLGKFTIGDHYYVDFSFAQAAAIPETPPVEEIAADTPAVAGGAADVPQPEAPTAEADAESAAAE